MKELERIDNYNNGELPEKNKMIITINNFNNPGEVLKNTKEIMKCISKYAYTNSWPRDKEWKNILPSWFVQSMISKTEKDRDQDINLWHFESWLESMENRAWEWWSSKIEENRIQIVFTTLNIPYIFEQFLYIFYSQNIPMENISVWDDIYGK